LFLVDNDLGMTHDIKTLILDCKIDKKELEIAIHFVV